MLDDFISTVLYRLGSRHSPRRKTPLRALIFVSLKKEFFMRENIYHFKKLGNLPPPPTAKYPLKRFLLLPVICLSLFAACNEPDEDNFDVIIKRVPAKNAPVDEDPANKTPAEDEFDDSRHVWVESTIAGGKTEVTFDKPYGIAIDDDRNLYVADHGNKCIIKLSRQLIEAGDSGDSGNSEASRTTE
jgi:hypothetical protein